MDPAVKEYFAKISRMGGRARAKKLTKEQRAESARRAAQARWSKPWSKAKQEKAGKGKAEA